MPTSRTYLDADVTRWLAERLPASASILDVGPGAGKWAKLLRPQWPNMDSLEIHEPYVREFDLPALYRSVYVEDVRAWHPRPAIHDLAIFGDMLEHLSAEDGPAVCARFHAANIVVLAVVPYNWKQGAIGGVAAEAHLQSDLNDASMISRYPTLRRIFYVRKGREQFGAYVTRRNALPRPPAWLEA